MVVHFARASAKATSLKSSLPTLPLPHSLIGQLGKLRRSYSSSRVERVTMNVQKLEVMATTRKVETVREKEETPSQAIKVCLTCWWR